MNTYARPKGILIRAPAPKLNSVTPAANGPNKRQATFCPVYLMDSFDKPMNLTKSPVARFHPYFLRVDLDLTMNQRMK